MDAFHLKMCLGPQFCSRFDVLTATELILMYAILPSSLSGRICLITRVSLCWNAFLFGPLYDKYIYTQKHAQLKSTLCYYHQLCKRHDAYISPCFMFTEPMSRSWGHGAPMRVTPSDLSLEPVPVFTDPHETGVVILQTLQISTRFSHWWFGKTTHYYYLGQCLFTTACNTAAWSTTALVANVTVICWL